MTKKKEACIISVMQASFATKYIIRKKLNLFTNASAVKDGGVPPASGLPSEDFPDPILAFNDP